MEGAVRRVAGGGEPMAEESPYLTHVEAATRARMSPTTLYAHNKAGTGPRRIRVGGRVLYRPEDVDEWLDEHAEPAAS
jgi:predicted DNA-binding transcriptional regulator AlpA